MRGWSERLDPYEPLHQRDSIMETTGLDQLLNVHGNLDASATLAARTRASAARVNLVQLAADFVETDLDGFVDCRRVHEHRPHLTARSTAPNKAAVERICEQSYGSFEGRSITRCCRKAAGGCLPAGASARPLAGRFDGLFGQEFLKSFKESARWRASN